MTTPFGLLSPNLLSNISDSERCRSTPNIADSIDFSETDSIPLSRIPPEEPQLPHRVLLSYPYFLLRNVSLRTDCNGKVQFDVVFGPAYKGISLGAVVSSALYSNHGIDVGYAYNRKEAKDHGEGGTLVGASMEGKKILIVDDVITAGTAIRESCELLKMVKAEPVGVVIALDRAEVRSSEDRVSAVQAAARDLSLKVVSIVNLPQLQSFLEGNPNYSEETLQSVAAYREEFGV